MENDILKFFDGKKELRTKDIVAKFKVSRQYVNKIINKLIKKGRLLKVGSTRNSFYIKPEDASFFNNKTTKLLVNKNLNEDKILQKINLENPSLLIGLRDNVEGIFNYAFLEMLNNAIEHSRSKKIVVEIERDDKNITFVIKDFGIGVFKNVMKKRHLKNELDAVQDLLKGKTTTLPKLHSGEGIFFTSKAVDIFVLESYGYKLTIDNNLDDIFLEECKKSKGTEVFVSISLASKKRLSKIFKNYSTDPEEAAFDKTEIKIKLYNMGTIHISRSQARRVLCGLDKFKTIIFDFYKVPTIGQGFADEIFRVFHNKYPNIKLETLNMNDVVRFMVERVDGFR